MNRFMSLSSLVATSLIFLALLSCTVCAEEDGEKDYQDFRAGLIELYTAGKYDEVAKLVEENYDRFPGKATNMSFNMALVCKHLEDYDKGIEYLSMAHERGHWFSIYAFQGDFWAPYREKEEFDAFLARNLEMKDAAQKKAKPKLEVVLPEEYEEGRTYPLFIALHGGGENIEIFKPQWKSGVMESEFIIAYVQSSQVSSMNG